MSDFYSGLQSTATRLLAQFGKPLTLRIQTGATYDPVTQTNAPAYADYAVFGVLLNYSAQDGGKINEAGTLVQTTDKKILVSVSNAPEPTMGALIVDSSTTYTIENVKALSPAGVSVIFELQGRL